MRRSSITLDDVTSWETLMTAFGRAALGKRSRGDVERFRSDLDRNLSLLQEDLRGGTYVPAPMRVFSIRDPKPRMIHAPSFRDRVVHHALMSQMGPVLDRSLIFDSYACRTGKGSHRSVERAACLSRRAPWCMHADIRQYFPSIDHGVLLTLLRRKFRDRQVLALVNCILTSHAKVRGLPIGALTSQNFANAYLGVVDRLVSEHPLARGYVRYMDDMVWWGRTRADCATVLQAVKGELAHLKLTLKAEPRVQRCLEGLTFCGFRVLPGKVLLSSRQRRRFGEHLFSAEDAYARGELSADGLQKRVTSVLAHVDHAKANTWRARKLALVSRDLDV